MEASPTTHSIPVGLSYSEFLDWLDEDIRAEWVDGEILVMSPASRSHQRIMGFLVAVLKLHVESNDLGEVILAPFQMRVSENSGREPDLIFVSRDRLEIVRETFVDGPADVVVEIVSPDSRKRDRVDKFLEYQNHGVQEYWIIDPRKEKATFYELKNEAFVPIELENHILRSPNIPGLWMDVQWLWANPTPSIPEIQRAWGVAP